jgi:hypothetical protein
VSVSPWRERQRREEFRDWGSGFGLNPCSEGNKSMRYKIDWDRKHTAGGCVLVIEKGPGAEK